MLTDLKTICAQADEQNICVGAFNVVSLTALHAVLDAAEELKLPVILQFAQIHENFCSLEDIGPAMVRQAEKASVPVCVHVDHGADTDYIRMGLDMGFTGAMFDGSTLPYRQNVEISASVAELAHSYGAGAEAELGSMGIREDGTGSGASSEKVYTDPDLAADFVRQTGVDLLACSFGTAHGIYLKAPKLDMNIITAVREKTGGIPVVMHGGSGVPDDQLRECIRAGVRKINYFTYLEKAGAAAIRPYFAPDAANQYPIYCDISLAAAEGMRENAKSAMLTFALR